MRTAIIDATDAKWLKNLFGTNVLFDEIMSKHTSLRVGGPADVFVLPDTLDQLTELVGWTRHRRLPYFVVGEGSNLLVKDKGIRGIVISLSKCLNGITTIDEGKGNYRVNAMAGTPLKRVCRHALHHRLSGMNFALGIPGTIGGGIKMNAGTARGEMKDTLDTIQVLRPDGTYQTVANHELNFSYRHLSLDSGTDAQTGNHPIILSGSCRLIRTDGIELKQEATSILKDRTKKQPVGKASAGSFFKNPSPEQPAGLLIDRAGCKGKTRGHARISAKHANFIINTKNASADDILWLMEYAQEKVFKLFQVTLEPEVNIVGD